MLVAGGGTGGTLEVVTTRAEEWMLIAGGGSGGTLETVTTRAEE